MKKVLLFVVVVSVLFVTGGTTVYASTEVPKVGNVDLTSLILPQPSIDDAALDYLQALNELEGEKSVADVAEVAFCFAEQLAVDNEEFPLRWWPEK